MDPYRTNRLNQSIREVLSQMLQISVKDPRVGFVTINSVELNRDHSVARIFWSVLGDEEDRKMSFAGLKKAKGYMQSHLARTLGLRAVPELRFEYDDTVARSVNLDNVLDGLAAEGEFRTEEDKKREMELEDLAVPPDLLEGLYDAECVWIVPHHNPDPDAMGSALALREALMATGREATVVSYPDPPAGFSEMPGFDSVVTSDEAEALYEEQEPDTLVLVDCHRIDRCGPLEEVLDRFETRWCVDHHLVSGRKAPEAGWVEPRSCSACTLIYRVITILGEGDPQKDEPAFEMTVDMGTNLYAGLATDTGGFRFSNTMPLTFELAKRLSLMGVDTAAVSRNSLHRHRPEGVAMMQRVLASFDYHNSGQVLIMQATREMLAESGAVLADTEGFVNIGTAVEGVKYVAFMKEREPGQWRISLRVRGDGDVQQIAARHGGGGHKQAAGCTLEGEADEVVTILARELGAALPR